MHSTLSLDEASVKEAFAYYIIGLSCSCYVIDLFGLRITCICLDCAELKPKKYWGLGGGAGRLRRLFHLASCRYLSFPYVQNTIRDFEAAAAGSFPTSLNKPSVPTSLTYFMINPKIS